MNSIDIRLGTNLTVLNDIKANLICTSPPYNIGSKSPRKDGSRKDGKFDAKSYGAITDYPDSLPENVYQNQQAEFMIWCAEHLTASGVLAYNHKPHRKNGSLVSPHAWFMRPEVQRHLTLMDEVVWDRRSTHNHSTKLFYPTTERIYIFRRADGTYPLDNRKSRGLQFSSDVWSIPPARKNGHNAPFPVEIPINLIKAFTEEGDTVCDPYSGSGTTAVAALRTNRKFAGSESMRKYYDLSLRRLADEVLV